MMFISNTEIQYNEDDQAVADAALLAEVVVGVAETTRLGNKNIPDEIHAGEMILYDLSTWPFGDHRIVYRRIWVEVQGVYNEFTRTQPNYSVEFEGQQYGVDHDTVKGWKPTKGHQLSLGFGF